jgi:hypothetical protein
VLGLVCVHKCDVFLYALAQALGVKRVRQLRVFDDEGAARSGGVDAFVYVLAVGSSPLANDYWFLQYHRNNEQLTRVLTAGGSETL